MSGRYEEPRPPQFRFEHEPERAEWIRIPAPRLPGQLAFFPLAILFVGRAGIMAFMEFGRTHEPFRAFAVLACAAFVAFFMLGLIWTLFGVEWVAATGGNLHIVHQLPGWTRRRIYPGGEISGLAPSQVNRPYGRNNASIPFVAARWGAVEFHYGGRRIWFAQGMDEAEGRLVVERLKRRLPAGA